MWGPGYPFPETYFCHVFYLNVWASTYAHYTAHKLIRQIIWLGARNIEILPLWAVQCMFSSLVPFFSFCQKKRFFSFSPPSFLNYKETSLSSFCECFIYFYFLLWLRTCLLNIFLFWWHSIDCVMNQIIRLVIYFYYHSLLPV